MDYLVEGVRTAAGLIVRFDPAFWEIVLLTLAVSLAATVIAAAAGLPLAFLVVTKEFRGREAVVTIMNTLMALSLGSELGLDVAIATKGHEWEHADRIAAAGRPLIVSRWSSLFGCWHQVYVSR